MSKSFLRKLKSSFSQRSLKGGGNSSTQGFKFKKSKRGNITRRTQTEYTWNSTTLFITLSIFVVMAYSVVQLGIGVYLDNQSKQLQSYLQEEEYLVEENQNIESKIAKHKSKVRVEIVAEK